MRLFTLLCTCIIMCSACELFIGIDDKYMDPFVNFDYMRDRIKDSYALLAWKEHRNGFSWDEVTRIARARIKIHMSGQELMDVLKDTLAVFKDAHIIFALPQGTSMNKAKTLFNTYIHNRFYGRNSGFTRKTPNKIFQYYLSPRLRKYGLNQVLLYGIIDPKKTAGKNLGFIRIKTFSDNKDLTITPIQKWAYEIDSIIKALMHTDGLILDIRQNPGGYPGNMLHIAGRFVTEKRHFMDMYMRSGPGRNDFAEPYQWHVEPQGPRQYTKPIILITDGGTGSNGEYFTLALRRFPYVTHFGQTTKGIMGNVMITQMPNGFGISYTSGYSEGFTDDNKKKNYEQDGIEPHISMSYDEVNAKFNSIRYIDEVDPMLDGAMRALLNRLP